MTGNYSVTWGGLIRLASSNCQDNFPALLLQTEWPIKKGGLPVRINAYLQFYHFYALNLVNMAESGVKSKGWDGGFIHSKIILTTHYLPQHKAVLVVWLLSDQVTRRAHAGMRDGGVLSVTLLHCSPLSLSGIWTRH